jgi:hypothetical protein
MTGTGQEIALAEFDAALEGRPSVAYVDQRERRQRGSPIRRPAKRPQALSNEMVESATRKAFQTLGQRPLLALPLT